MTEIKAEQLLKEAVQKDDKKLAWTLRSICPLNIGFSLPLGFAKNSEKSAALLQEVARLDPEIKLPQEKDVKNKEAFADSHYLNIANDTSTIRLFTWEHFCKHCNVELHVFPNSIAIAEFHLPTIYENDPDILDEKALEITRQALDSAFDEFNHVLKRLQQKMSNSEIEFNCSETKAKAYWPSRSLMLSKKEVKDPARAKVIQHWLSETIRAEDAAKLIEGTIQYSMTWLKYVVVEDAHKASMHDFCIDAMVIAQYCYTAQEKCNRDLRLAIEAVFQGEKKKLESELQKAKRSLEKGRVTAKLHKVTVNESLRLLQPKKRELIKDIFIGWEYERLVNNGDTMLDLCADKINESNSRQAKISAYKTEYILIGISLFTVLDFFFFVTQFSREAMANPTLDHNDGGPSSFLTIIANIPADLMFFIGVVAVGFIFLAYRKVKG
ncbi:hypothetical protein ISG33_11725 [Glaciecola sp. MH2013]|uniref:hypothetical protein n=1 Tax=Glaciecola sp. MH2013 TaxID=2785524 RepID=UPI00189FDEB9|nr:hypothetical protein [Glaciecola sp. MH2013]MBF7074068.1 hypothetical protein [Glaciecola sp. MH2013]